jgi:hypothetical protein
MNKTLLTFFTSVALCLSANQVLAQTRYQSPFGGSYIGDFKDYKSENPSAQSVKKIKVQTDKVVLLNTNDTLVQDITTEDLAQYIMKIDDIVQANFNHLTESHAIALQAVFNSNKHVINLAYQNKLNKADTLIFRKTYEELNKIKAPQVNPDGTHEDIKFEIYYTIDTTLPTE